VLGRRPGFKFHDIHAAWRYLTAAARGLGQIGKLYAIEKRINSKRPDLRMRIRQAEAVP
jgi:hypothetical protein